MLPSERCASIWLTGLKTKVFTVGKQMMISVDMNKEEEIET